MKYLLVQFLLVFVQLTFYHLDKPLLNDIGPLTGIYQLSKIDLKKYLKGLKKHEF